MNWKRFSTLTGSLFVLLFCGYKAVVACGDSTDPYDYYPQFFSPSILQQPTFAPFHYSAHMKYYDDWWEYNAEGEIPDANIAAWSDYTSKAVPRADLDSFIYRFPYSELSALYYNIEKGTPMTLRPDVAGNAFTKWVQRSTDLEALGYLMYAKSCEPFVTSSNDWEAPANPDTAKLSRLIKSGGQLYDAAKADFFKERFAYQVIRLALYNSRPKQALQLYTKLVGDTRTEGTEIFARSLALKAGALFRTKRKAEAAYLFSRAFDMSDEKKRSSYLSFDWAVGQNAAPVLALCKTPHERAVVHIMDGLHHYEQALPQLQAAYAADPAVRGLDVLFAREINKVEERYLQDELLMKRALTASQWYYNHYEGATGDDSPEARAKVAKWKAYNAALVQFAQKVAGEGKGGRPAFWTLATAYLHFVSGDANAAKRSLDAAQHMALNPREADLHRTITGLYIIRAGGGMNSATEERLLPTMQWLDERAVRGGSFQKTYRDMMTAVIATAYMEARDTVKAVYTLGRVARDSAGKFYVDPGFLDLPGTLLEAMSVEKLRELQAFISRGNKSRWDGWLTRNSSYNISVLAELEGTKALRAHKFTEAITAFKKADARLLAEQMVPDPFAFHVDEEIWATAADSGRLYTKKAFAEAMAALEGKEDAQSLFAWGCGLYSITYYGKAFHAVTYYRSTSDQLGYHDSKERRALSPAMRDYYAATSAEAAFVKAAAKATDGALKAKCIWMAARCWQKRCPLPAGKTYWDSYDDREYYLYSLRNPYFAQLATGADFEAAHELTYSTCGYLRDYLNKRKK